MSAALQWDADSALGLSWFNGLTRAEREYWLERARREHGRSCPFDASAAEAWEAFKRANQ